MHSVIAFNSQCINRFQQLGGIEYLEESITYYRQRLNLCAIGDPNRSFFLNNLTVALLPHGHLNRSFSLHNLANTSWPFLTSLCKSSNANRAPSSALFRMLNPFQFFDLIISHLLSMCSQNAPEVTPFV